MSTIKKRKSNILKGLFPFCLSSFAIVLLTAATVSCKTEVTEVRLNKTELTLTVGETETLIATIFPEDASNKAVSWKSNNNDVAVVDNNGKVTAQDGGTALITVSTKDGNKKATCSLTVRYGNIMDTIKGEWRWVKGSNWYDSFESTLKIVSQNKDGSINYEVFVENTSPYCAASYIGSFQFYYDERNIRRIDNLGLPYGWDGYKFCFATADWAFFFMNNFQTWMLYDVDAVGGFSFFYQKIK